MKTKTFVLLIVLFIALFVLGFIGFQFYMKQEYTPGAENIAKSKVAVIYCSYGEGLKGMVDIVKNKTNADLFELKSAVAYPTDKEKFAERIKNENNNLSSVILDNQDINIRKYKFFIFATPVIQNKACPVLQKLINDNSSRFKNKATAYFVLYDDKKDNPKETTDFFYYRLYESRQKPGFMTLKRGQQQLNYEIKLWLDNMSFKREELR